MPTPVMMMRSTDAGAPTFNNAAGSLIAVLDACLVNGYNSKTVSSLVVAGGIATATISAHGYLLNRFVLIAGATPAGLNGEKRILSVPDANTITFDATGISNQTATGTISSKTAPLGWAINYTGTNLRVYNRTEVGATAQKLRVSDTAGSAAAARLYGVETATGISTNTGRFPTNTQVANGSYWSKGNNTTTPKPWMVIGDGKRFFFCMGAYQDATEYGSPDYYRTVYFFGDIVSYKGADAYHCLLSGTSYDEGGSPSGPQWNLQAGSTITGALDNFICRTGAQTGTAKPVVFSGAMGTGIISTAAWPDAPDPVTGEVLIHQPILVIDSGTGANAASVGYRGALPGAAQLLHNNYKAGASVYQDGDYLTGLVGTSKEFVAWKIGATAVMLFDRYGPWS